MPKCKQCGKEVILPFECKFCGHYFCTEHRLPENHNCPNQPPRTPLGRWQAKREVVYSQPKKETCKFASEGNYHIIKEKNKSEKVETRKHFPIKKVVGFSLAIVIIGVLVWQMPTIISHLQNYSLESSYTKLTLSSSSTVNFTSITFGEMEYSFEYSYNGLLLVSNSLLETRTYNPVNGSVYIDIGIEIKVSEVYSDHIIIFVKPNPQDYLAKSSFKKLIIANGQYQNLNFSGNEYTIGYVKNPPYYLRTLVVTTPLLQTREYQVYNQQIISCDLGLEIRVYKSTDEFVTIFVKPLY